MVKIRKTKKSELKKLARFMKEEFGRSPYYEKWTDKTSMDKIKEYDKLYNIHVAFVNKKIAGFVVSLLECYYDANKIFIHELVVGKKFQGKGIGKSLMREIEKVGKKKKADTIYLMAMKKAPAYKFYGKIGFKENKTITMEKKIK